MIAAIVAMGDMGSGVAACLTAQGATVRTALAGRSGTSAARAQRAGALVCSDAELLDGADLFLSIVPPAAALELAERFAPHLRALATKPAYVDCNAISAQEALAIARVVAATGTAFIDAGIIGGPPKANGAGPRFYVSAHDAQAALALCAFGLDVVDLHAPAGTASSLKIGYAALTKGVVALGTAIELGATHAGVADALHAECARSQPELYGYLTRRMGEAPAKAHRWIAEMDGVAEFLNGADNGSDIYTAIARFYQTIAAEQNAKTTR